MRSSWIVLMLLTVAVCLGVAGCSDAAEVAGDDSSQSALLHAGAPGPGGAPVAAEPDDGDGDEDGDDDEFEESVPLAELPQVVLDAVEAAVPGLDLTSAELEMEAGKTAYCIHGTLDDQPLEVEVAPDGTLLEIERD